MYKPLVSIIIPVYNGSNYLKESIDSALAQTYKNIEIIVVNDGSKDNGETENIALSFGNKIKYYYKNNGGVASALNYGISKMSGEWFSWLSHDDLYMPTKIESQIRCVNNNSLDHEKTIISCNYNLINSNGTNIYNHNKFKVGLHNGKEMFKELSKGMNLNGCSLLIPRIALKKIGCFNEEYRFMQDRVCWGKLAMNENYFYLYDEKLVKSRVHDNQDTIRLANIQPVEYEKYLLELLDESILNKKNGVFYIKTTLFYYLTRRDNKKLKLIYIKKLKEIGEYKISEKIRYSFLSLRGILNRVLRKIYRTFVNRRYRGAK